MNPRNWSLRARVLAVMVGLLALTSIVIGGVVFLVLRDAVKGQFDAQLTADAQRFNQRGTGPEDRDDLFSKDMVLVEQTDTGGSAGIYVEDVDDTHYLNEAQVVAVQGLEGKQGPQTLDLGGDYGEYRFVETRIGPNVLFVGEPLTGLNRSLAQRLTEIGLIVLAAIVIAALLGALMLRRALRPLQRVATVANDVSRMRLETGEVDLAERVPERDTNPHTEVGKVGLALNGLLDTVGTALEKRQRSEAKLRTFVADASHELRTPLASIRGYAELTRRFGGPLGEDATHNIARIESEAKRMTSLVEDLLLLARLDAQRELDEADVDLSRLLVDVVSDAHAAGRDHEWDLDLPDDPVVIRGDDARLHQVFTNLLANARVHTPAGTRVTVELKPPVKDLVEVCVRDSGPGIPEQLQPTLFERFVRGDSSRQRKTGSTGLGLSIVSAVVKAHHGSVSVESKPGDTVFTVRLPVRQPLSAAGAPASGATAVPKPQPQPATV